jgi:hypothetical protein
VPKGSDYDDADYYDYYYLGDSPVPVPPVPTAAAAAPVNDKPAETIKTSHSERVPPTRSARLSPVRPASSKALGIY